MKDRFESLESGEVISVQQDTPVLGGQRTFRVGELNDGIKKQLESAIEGWSQEKSAWFSATGIDCEALRFGSNGWQRGRIRLCLEFCPDEPSTTAEGVGSNVAPIPPSNPNIPAEPAHSSTASVVTASVEPVTTHNSIEPVAAKTPDVALMGVALGTVAVGAAAVMATQPETASLPTPDLADDDILDVVEVPLEAEATTVATPDLVAAAVETSEPTPHLTEAVLVTEEDPLAESIDLHSAGDEISYQFDGNNGDSQGAIVPDGMMELDLSDLDLDRAEHDYLNFEATGMFDSAQDLANLPDLDRSKNSEALIDEVWNEINQQPSWPGIH
jgi:KGK domain